MNRKKLKIFQTLKTESDNMTFRRPEDEFLVDDKMFAKKNLGKAEQKKAVEEESKKAEPAPVILSTVEKHQAEETKMQE